MELTYALLGPIGPRAPAGPLLTLGLPSLVEGDLLLLVRNVLFLSGVDEAHLPVFFFMHAMTPIIGVGNLR